MVRMRWDPFGEDFSPGGLIGAWEDQVQILKFRNPKNAHCSWFAKCCLLVTFLCLRGFYLKIWLINCRLGVSERQNRNTLLFLNALTPFSRTPLLSRAWYPPSCFQQQLGCHASAFSVDSSLRFRSIPLSYNPWGKILRILLSNFWHYSNVLLKKLATAPN